MPCLVCHVRNDNSAGMRYSGHIPCASCHQEQFAQGNSSPMCYICHTETGVKAFPGLKSFSVSFDHGRHTKLTNCATCHRPTRRGVALSIPSRTSAHTTCFQCHGPGARSGEKDIATCSTCHQPGRPPRTSESAKAFGMNFSHSEHARKGLSCSQCHMVMAGGGRGRQVTSPTAAMHLVSSRVKSCASCHNNQRAFGGNDFSDCKRCHQGRSFGF
ncbi:MAG TPA: cytochrome c3 family protein [Pyrinomonadaceae bacterium]|nr:cytochrome c3 family protein [Pyrinomonadaceae bacterium]